jgi:hypothetical protein
LRVDEEYQEADYDKSSKYNTAMLSPDLDVVPLSAPPLHSDALRRTCEHDFELLGLN